MNKKFMRSALVPSAWLLSIIVVGVAITVWGQNVAWNVTNLSTYSWFPLFGLVAFSLMWGHYIITATREAIDGDAEALKPYYRVTSWIVLIAILLHPGLLIWQLWADGFGLPPGSYLTHYVAPELGWVALLGTVSLLAFLAYELWRWFDKKPWWRWVSWASEFAMVAIFFHGWKLGTELQVEWFQVLWLVYGLTLVSSFAYLHWSAYRTKRDPEPWRTRGMITGVIVVAIGTAAILAVLIS